MLFGLLISTNISNQLPVLPSARNQSRAPAGTAADAWPPSQAPWTPPQNDQFAREMDWMADVVRGKAPMVSPGEEGLQDMRLMRAILESVAKDGATVATDWGYRRAYDPAAVVDVPGKA